MRMEAADGRLLGLPPVQSDPCAVLPRMWQRSAESEGLRRGQKPKLQGKLQRN